MKRQIRNTILAGLFVTTAHPVLTALAADEAGVDVEQAIKALKSSDSGLTNLFNQSAGFAVFPCVDKAGIVIGGEHGKGLVYENGKAIGKTTLTGITVGAQMGGQSFYEVIFFGTAQALENFKKGKFEMSADVSAVATDGVAKNALCRSGVTVFTLPMDGLMLEATIGGQKFTYKPLN